MTARCGGARLRRCARNDKTCDRNGKRTAPACNRNASRAPRVTWRQEDLQVAVNAAIALERPLLVKGEPGTGEDRPRP